MKNCPKCHKKISYLDNFQTCVNVYEFRGSGDYVYTDTIAQDETNYECPKCHTVLFTDEYDAEQFFKPVIKH